MTMRSTTDLCQVGWKIDSSVDPARCPSVVPSECTVAMIGAQGARKTLVLDEVNKPECIATARMPRGTHRSRRYPALAGDGGAR